VKRALAMVSLCAAAACSAGSKTPAATQEAPPARPEVGSSGKEHSQHVGYIQKVALYNLAAEPRSGGDGPRTAAVTLEIKNTGDKTLDHVIVGVYFLDATGTRIHETSVMPVMAGGDGPAAGPLAPNAARAYRGSVTGIPPRWDGRIEAVVTSAHVIGSDEAPAHRHGS
jgi:hypothetical protein